MEKLFLFWLRNCEGMTFSKPGCSKVWFCFSCGYLCGFFEGAYLEKSVYIFYPYQKLEVTASVTSLTFSHLGIAATVFFAGIFDDSSGFF